MLLQPIDLSLNFGSFSRLDLGFVVLFFLNPERCLSDVMQRLTVKIPEID
jgi:hypothetical protein